MILKKIRPCLFLIPRLKGGLGPLEFKSCALSLFQEVKIAKNLIRQKISYKCLLCLFHSAWDKCCVGTLFT